MIWAFLCGLLFGGLLLDVWQKESARRRNERIRKQIDAALRQIEWGERVLATHPDCHFEVCWRTPCSDLDDLPFSDDPLPEDAELPEFITGTNAADLCQAGYVDSHGILRPYDGEF